MAVDFTDLTAINDTLKIVYGEGLTNQFNDEVTTYHQFDKSDRVPKGQGYAFGIRYDRSQSVGGRRESERLPPPLVGKYDQGLIKPVNNYGTLRLTGPAIEAGKGDIAAFVDTLSDQMDDILNSIVVDLNRQSWSDGFGLLGTLTIDSDSLTTSSTTWTVTCDNALGLQYMKPGMIVDFHAGASIDQSAVASRVSSVDPAAKTMEMEFNDGTYKALHPIVAAQSYSIATDSVPSGSTIVRMGVREASFATTDVAVELTGLNGIYDDGTNLATFENITVANFEKWQANILGNSSVDRELSIDLMLQALDLTRIQSGKRINTMRMGLGQKRKYYNLLEGDVRYTPGKFHGGYETLTFQGGDGAVKMVIDPVAFPGRIYFEPDGVIKKYEMTPLGWGDLDGSRMHRVSNFDQWDLFLRLYSNLGCEERVSLTRLDDLTEPSIYS